MTPTIGPDVTAMTDHQREAFWITNLREALRMMSAVPDEGVKLRCWLTYKNDSVCGTIACFGGWCPFDPYFKALVVVADEAGMPSVETEFETYREAEVADYLFGDNNLFDARWAREGDPSVLTDKQVVLKRITQRLRELGVEA